MANIFEGELKMTDDWGRVINSEFPEGAPASGEAAAQVSPTAPESAPEAAQAVPARRKHATYVPPSKESPAPV